MRWLERWLPNFMGPVVNRSLYDLTCRSRDIHIQEEEDLRRQVLELEQAKVDSTALRVQDQKEIRQSLNRMAAEDREGARKIQAALEIAERREAILQAENADLTMAYNLVKDASASVQEDRESLQIRLDSLIRVTREALDNADDQPISATGFTCHVAT